ncbi:MAG: DUF1080 domain-containing protein [Verrucomicrobia bacterium]|nr:MAG: DUF1080 domain-containing protein [Verrucomicrobiota bacterium]
MKATPLLFACFGLASAPTTQADWTPLFNGIDLTGWHQLNGRAPYTVVDDAIVGTAIADTPNSFLATDAVYGDFVFECEVKVEGSINSGVQFRSLSTPDYRDGRVHGYQCEIDDKTARSWTGGIYDEARRGWLYPLELNPPSKSAYLPGRWTHLRIECVGSSIRTWVNGIPAAHLIDSETAEGFIALQVHSIKAADATGRRIHWRNLRVRTDVMEPTPNPGFFIRNTMVNSLSAAEIAQGWRLLWDGRTSDGWRGANSDAYPTSGWTIVNGALTVGGANQAERIDLVTDERFSAFEFQTEFRVEKGGNSGIKYFLVESSGDDHQGTGLEYQLLDDEGHPDAEKGAAGNRTLASLYDLIPSRGVVATREVPREAEVWHHARIVVHSSQQVEHWLNGFKVVEFERGSPLFQALVARSKYADIEGFASGCETSILLQDHGDQVSFRSIKVRELN